MVPAAFTPVPPDSRSQVEAETQRQKTALLFRNAGIAQAVNVVNAALLAFTSISQHGSSGVAVAWWGVVATVAAGRYLLARRFLAAAPDAAAAPGWRRRYLAGTALVGATWGSGTVLFMWGATDGAMLFSGLVLSGMVAGAVPLLSPVPAAFRTFAILVAAPMSAVVLLQADSPLRWSFGVMSAIFLASVLASARYLHETLDRGIRLGLEQRRLVEDLERARHLGERALAEREAQAATQRLLTAAVEQSNSSVVITDYDARIIFVNSAFTATTGYQPDEVLGQNPRVLKSGTMPEEIYRDLWATIAGGRSWQGELCNRNKAGQLYWEAANISPIVDPDGRITNYLAVKDNITQRKQVEAEVARLSEWNELLLNSVGEGIYGADGDGNCTFINPAALATLGFTLDEVSGKNVHRLFHHHHRDGSPYPTEDCPLSLTRHDGVRREVEDVFIRKDGEAFPVQLAVTPMREDGQLIGVAVVFQDISRRKALEEELTWQATTDPLTGVANRRRFVEEFELELERVRRFGRPSALLMADIDHFKRINDTHGHPAGDAVLKHLAEISRHRLRRIDLFGRLGGEEFGILLPGTDVAGAIQCAEDFRRHVEGTPAVSGEQSIAFTISIGIALFGPGEGDAAGVMARADRALYRAKEGGRNRVEAE